MDFHLDGQILFYTNSSICIYSRLCHQRPLGLLKMGGGGDPPLLIFYKVVAPSLQKENHISTHLRYTQTYILLLLYKDILIKCHIHEPKNGDVSSNKTLLSISTDFSHHLVLNLVSKYSNMSQLEVLSRMEGTLSYVLHWSPKSYNNVFLSLA